MNLRNNGPSEQLAFGTTALQTLQCTFGKASGPRPFEFRPNTILRISQNGIMKGRHNYKLLDIILGQMVFLTVYKVSPS